MEEFLKDPEFIAWVKEGKNQEYWSHFISIHPEKAEEILAAKAVILAGGSLPYYSINDDAKTELWNTIQFQILAEENQTPISTGWKQSNRYWFTATASLLLLSLFTGWYYFQNSAPQAEIKEISSIQNTESPVQEWAEISNNKGNVLPVQLPDGSSVVLQKDSRIKYSTTLFNKEKREIFLSGEAFFEVVKDPLHPFIVYSGEVATKVLGTSFTIRSYPTEKEVKVLVNTGKVSVYKIKPSPEKAPDTSGEPITVLTNNEQILLNHLDPIADISSANLSINRKITVPIQAFSFNYENAVITEIFEDIKAAYGIDIVWDEELMGNCRITGKFSNENLYEKLNLICHSIDASYETTGSVIAIQSSGCQ